MPTVYSAVRSGIEGLDANPLDEQRPMIGGQSTTVLNEHQDTAANWNAQATAALMNGSENRVSVADRIILIRTLTGGAVTRTAVSVSAWFALRAADAGATLDNSNSFTVYEAGTNLPIARIGRNPFNRPLIQKAGADVTAEIRHEWEVESWDGGLVGRRLGVFEATRSQGQKVLILGLRSATRPTLASAGIRYNGATLTGVPSPWIEVGTGSVSGAGTEWRAFATATHSPYTGLWTISDWTITQAEGDPLHVEYSTDQSTWTSSPPASLPYYVRYLTATGWVSHYLSDGPRQWRDIGYIEQDLNISSGQWFIDELDWSNASDFCFEHQQAETETGGWLGPHRPVVVPAYLVHARPFNDITGQSGQTIVFTFKEANAGGFHIGTVGTFRDWDDPGIFADNGYVNRIWFQFNGPSRLGNTFRGQTADKINILRTGYTGRPYRIHMRIK